MATLTADLEKRLKRLPQDLQGEFPDVPADMIERMRQADLFRVMQPQVFGGFEYGFEVFGEIVATLAAGCGSTGWVYGLLASHQWLIGCFSRAAQDEVWLDPSALAAGTYAPVAQAVAVEGGGTVRL